MRLRKSACEEGVEILSLFSTNNEKGCDIGPLFTYWREAGI